MLCTSASRPVRTCDPGMGCQCPKDRKPIRLSTTLPSRRCRRSAEHRERPRCSRPGVRLRERRHRAAEPRGGHDARMRIDVAASLTMSSPAPATALLEIAVARPAAETLTVLTGGRPADVEEFEADGARVHRLTLAEGETTVTYTASAEDGGPPRRVTAAEWAGA